MPERRARTGLFRPEPQPRRGGGGKRAAGDRPETWTERLPSHAPGTEKETPALFDTDVHLDIPIGDMLAEVGIDPAAVSEIIANDRAIRCPDCYSA